MKYLRKVLVQVPNGVTSLNVLCGCLSVFYSFHNHLILAAIFIFLGGLFDFLDGMVARLLHAFSELGKSLDSLADMVTFGLAPSVILLQLQLSICQQKNSGFTIDTAGLPLLILVFSPFLITVFSALRLAKFNTDPRQSSTFIGVPTPANAFLIASLAFVSKDYPQIIFWQNNILLLLLTLLLSFLLVSEIPMISLKFKNFTWKDNLPRYLLLVISAFLLICWKISAYPIIFVLYMCLSIIFPAKLIAQSK